MKQNFTIRRHRLDGVEAFLCVARHRSFRKAADDLQITPSAISQAIRAFEEKVGVPLLTRTTRSVGLTQAGELFLQRAQTVIADLDAAYDAARSMGDRPAGLLRLHAPRSSLSFLIAPIIASFCSAFPDVEVEIFGDDHLVDLVEAGFDAGVRQGELLEADVIALRLTAPHKTAVVATPDIIARDGIPLHPSDLRSRNCIRARMIDDRISNWEFEDAGRKIEVAVSGKLIVNDMNLQLAAARRGAGYAYVAEALVERDLKSGRLQSVLGDFTPYSPGMFLYYPNRRQILPKLRAFIDHVRSHSDRFYQGAGRGEAG